MILAFTVLFSLVLASAVLAFTVLPSAMLPFTALHRAVSTSASFTLLLFIYWKFHVTEGQNRSLFCPGSNVCLLLSPIFYFCASYFCPLLLLPPLNHSMDISRCYRIFNILLSAISRSKGNFWRLSYFENAPVKKVGIGIVISASLTSLPYSITSTTKWIRCDNRPLNTHVPSKVSADLSFDRSFTFQLCVRFLSCWEVTIHDQSIDKYNTFHFCGWVMQRLRNIIALANLPSSSSFVSFYSTNAVYEHPSQRCHERDASLLHYSPGLEV